MIVGSRKPVEEIAASIENYCNVLVVGCGSCVTVCLSGGEKEVRKLVQELAVFPDYKKFPPVLKTSTIARQCEFDLVKTFLEIPPDTDAILSLACGAGVQILADVFEPIPVIPALNTTFLGAADEPGIWREKCRGCGQCVLLYTGGICPITRCAKSLLNGPCGGTQGDQCEINPEVPCAWVLIFNRLKKQNNLHLIEDLKVSRDWRPGGAKGPRERRRTGIGGSTGD
ncbi:MAG: methylenetetrahydrofolate reductase C-terminal domain-containing protein [Deltaproteobacteria bacterium]|nr:methylenetetrahydrofolate reductase C-terminal domain-containing protein [Deltaproteobacteria bacterium]